MSDKPLHVLVIDDSAVVRHTVTRLLAPMDGWRLETAPDPVVGLERIRNETPDVILLDLEMPRMDGLTFLRHIMATEPIPVVICSGYAAHGTRLAMAALEAGAVEILPKPRLAVKEFLEGAGSALVSVLREAAAAGPSLKRRWRREVPGDFKLVRTPGGRGLSAARQTAPPGGAHPSGATILIGASMGGPEALRQILAEFPSDGAACVVVQHMPKHFTSAFANRLDQVLAMNVREAEDGDPVVPGQVLVAPGGRHLQLEAGPGGPLARIVDGSPVHGHMPSVDVLFESSARVLGPSAIAAVLTGMGVDGAQGLRALANAGAQTLVQDESSCIVFGMPGAALDRGGAQRLVPLGRIGQLLLELADQGTSRSGVAS